MLGEVATRYVHLKYDTPSMILLTLAVFPILAKILEKLVASQLSTYFEQHQLLSEYQGAYRASRSTEQILLFATNSITQALDAGKVVCTTFLDRRKAFDSLDHVILLERLGTLGVHDIELTWFTNSIYRIVCSASDIETRCLLGLL